MTQVCMLNSPKPITPAEIRFSASETPRDLAYEQTLKQTRYHSDLYQSRVTQEPSRRARTEKTPLLKRMVYPIMTALTLAMGVAGFKGVSNYYSSQPSGPSAPVTLKWQEVADWAKQVNENKTTYNYDLETQIQFQEQLQDFLKTFADVMAASPDAADQALAEKINFSSLEKDVVVDNVGMELFNYLHGQKTEGKPLQVQDFVEKHAAFNHLTPREKEHLAATIFKIYNDSPDIKLENFDKTAVEAARKAPNNSGNTPERQLRDALEVYIGNKVAGISLEKFLSVDTQEEALALFETVVNNPGNLQQLSAEDRAAFLKEGKEVLENVDFDSQAHGFWSYGLLAYALLVVGGAGTIGSGVSGVKKVKTKLKEVQEARNAQNNRPPLELVVVPNYSQEEKNLENSLYSRCVEMLELRAAAQKAHPEVAEFMNSLYPKKQLDRNALACYYTNQAHNLLLNVRGLKKVTQSELLDTALQLVKEASERKDYLPELAGNNFAPNPDKIPVVLDSEPMEKQIKTEIQQINHRLGATHLMLINQLIAHTERQQVVAQQEAKIAEMVSGKPGGKKGKKEQVASAEAQAEEAPAPLKKDNNRIREEKRLDSFKRALADSQQLVDEVRSMINTLEENRLACQLMLIELLDTETYNATVADLERIQGIHDQQKKSPTLQGLQTKLNVQARVKNIMRDDLDKQRQARALVEEKLKSLGEKASD